MQSHDDGDSRRDGSLNHRNQSHQDIHRRHIRWGSRTWNREHGAPPALLQYVDLELIDAHVVCGGRIALDASELRKLSRSIEQDGLREPLEVRAKGDGRFELLNGEARYWALKAIHTGSALCRIVDYSGRESLERKMRGDEGARVKRTVIEDAWLTDEAAQLLAAEDFDVTVTLLMDRSGWSRGKVHYSTLIGSSISRELFGRASEKAGLSIAEAASISKRPLVSIAKVPDTMRREELLTGALTAMAKEGEPAAATRFVKDQLQEEAGKRDPVSVSENGVTVTLPLEAHDLDEASRLNLVEKLCGALNVSLSHASGGVHLVNACQVMHPVNDPDGLGF